MEFSLVICFISSGLTGFTIFKQTRPSFYVNRSEIWMLWVTTIYILLGPAIFLFSLPTLLNPEK